MSEPKEIKNKLKFGGEEFKFSTDTEITEGSNSFITSGAVAEWVKTYSQLAGRGVVTSVDYGNGGLPTSDAVWSSVNKCAKRNTTTDHVTTVLPQNVFTVIANQDAWKTAGVTYYPSSGTNLLYCTSSSSSSSPKGEWVLEPIQRNRIYYNKTTNKLCFWDESGSLTNITL